MGVLGSIDGGATYFPITATPFGNGTDGPAVSSVSAPGQWEVAVGALSHVRVTASALTSGSAAVTLAAANGAKVVRVKAPATDPLPVGGTVGLSGTLPGFAAAPTVNLGTLNGAATDASVLAVKTALGSPLQAGGAVAIADGGAATLGAKADAAATGGAVSLIALVKGLIAFFVGATLTSRSTTTPAAPASTALFPANAARRKWLVQAPQLADLWLNPLGGMAAVNGTDCVCIAAGGVAQADGICCETGAFTYYCATGGLAVTAWEA